MQSLTSIANFDSEISETIHPILDKTFPIDKVSVYITHSGGVDVAVEFRGQGEFGEICRAGDQALKETQGPYGVVAGGITELGLF